jgi:hypothetical protein
VRPRAAVAAAALLALAAGCRTAGPAIVPADPARTAQSVTAVFAARERAWAPRRFKALYRGEVAPKAGLAMRGFLSLFWDGETLEWKASVPLAGTPRTGAIRRGDLDAGGLFPGPLVAADVLAALLGVPEELPTGEGALLRGGRVELRLPSGGGRAVLVAEDGSVTGLVLSGGVRVELLPGPLVPGRIEVLGREGTAVLSLESYGPWPEGEGSRR